MYYYSSYYVYLTFFIKSKLAVSFHDEIHYTSSNGEVKDGETGDQLHKPFRGEFILIAPERHRRKKLGELGIHRHPHLYICRTTSRPFVIQPAGAHTGFKFSEVKMEIVSPSRYDMSAIFLLIKQSFNTSRQSLVWISLV